MKNTFFLAPLTKAINTYLALDAQSKKRLMKLQGKIVGLTLLPFNLSFQCEFHEEGVRIHKDLAFESHTHLKGTPLQMMGMMLNKENRQHFFADDLVIEGDAEVGQRVVELFDELQIDWEDQLSRFIGDIPAYHAKRLMQNLSGWLGRTDESLSQNINDYFHEEALLFPSFEALKDFFNDIDLLRMDVDRMEARVMHLQENLLGPQNPLEEEVQ